MITKWEPLPAYSEIFLIWHGYHCVLDLFNLIIYFCSNLLKNIHGFETKMFISLITLFDATSIFPCPYSTEFYDLMHVSSRWVHYINSWKKYCSCTTFLFNIRKKNIYDNPWLIFNFGGIHFWQVLSSLPNHFVTFLAIKDSFPGISLDRWMERGNMLTPDLTTWMWVVFVVCSSFFVLFKLQLSATREWSPRKVKNHTWHLTSEVNMNWFQSFKDRSVCHWICPHLKSILY